MKIPIPREHGTWAMLYAPLLCAVVSAGVVNFRFALFLLSTTAAFFFRDPFESWIRLRKLPSADPVRVQHLFKWSIIYLATAIVSSALLILLYSLWLLPVFALFFVLMIPLHLYWISRHEDRQIYAELTAVVALSSSAPACRYAMTGALDSTGWLLWFLNVLFFASSVFYVKMRVSRVAKKHHSNHAVFFSCLYHTLLVIALVALWRAGLISWLMFLAFAPILFRAFSGVADRGKLSLTRIGISEVAFTVVFVLFMILSFRPF